MNLRALARRHWWTAAVAVVAAVVLGLVLVMLVMIGDLRGQQARQAKVVSDLSVNLSGAQDQLKQHGITPKQPPPSQIIAQAGPAGAQGPQGSQGPGPSDTQVAAAVATYLQQHPIAGEPPTTEQVAAVVAVYMVQHPATSGSPGPTGAAGPGPSDQQIRDAVAAWESQHSTVGPSGPSGPAGVPGPSGPSGAAGPSGASGASGQPGVPGPSGASGPSGPAPSGLVIVGQGVLGPTTQTCTPDPAPHYACN